GFDLGRARAVLAILRAIVGGQHLDFVNGLDAGIDVEGEVAAIVHHVAAVDFPIVVFGAAAVDAVADAALDADLAFVLPGLIADAGNQLNELGKDAPVQL